MLYIPDLGYTLVVSAVLVLGWGILRTALAFLLQWNAKRVMPGDPGAPAEM